MTIKKAIILVGGQGSGKSTYCEDVVPDYFRVSQDLQGKDGHWIAFISAIARADNIVVDRINHLRKQRKRYVDELKTAGYHVTIIKMNEPYHICLGRLRARTEHPTLDNKCEISLLNALSMYFKQYQDVRKNEADSVISLTDYDPFIQDLTSSGYKKFLIIGDVHGCANELNELISKHDSKETAIVFLGDLVDKGDSILETLDLVCKTDGTFIVIGNHEGKLLRYLRGNKVSITHGLDKTIQQLGLEDITTENAFTYRCLFETLPAMIKLPGDVYCIHAGIDPSKPVVKQNRETLMYARTFDPITKNLRDADKFWFEYYTGKEKIFFGHQVHDKVNVAKNAYAMDGGCVHGGELRGMLYDSEKQTFELTTVKAKKMYTPSKVQEDEIFEPYDKLVQEGYLRKVEDGDLVLYNYTDKCTFDGQWNKYTMECRGLVFNKKTLKVVARPFPKFFNLGEKEFTQFSKLPDLPYTVHEKNDGSMGIIFHDGTKWRVNTRGSFSSDQAIEATRMLEEKYDLGIVHEDTTLLVEIIYPENKIIVDYGEERKLVLLGLFDRRTGKEYTCIKEIGTLTKMESAKKYSHTIEEMIELQKTIPKNEEGFVVRFENGLRVKIKGDEYLKIARIMSKTSPLTLWESMTNGTVSSKLMEAIPEEILGEYTPIQDILERKYSTSLIRIHNEFTHVQALLNNGGNSRKFIANFINKTCVYTGPMFALLDGRESIVDKYIMKNIKPTGNVL